MITHNKVSGRRISPQAAVGLMSALLILTSCSSPSAAEQYLPEAASLQSAVVCSPTQGLGNPSTGAAADKKGRVPDGFIPVDAVRCVPDTKGAVVSEERLSGDYAPLLKALAIPSERGGEMNCLDYADTPLELWLINAQGQAINVTWPTDNCEHLMPATATALEALSVRESKLITATGGAS
ncbi:hypothetical protein [Arthrobacter psychrolactophilus]|uniref:hypothetical protein n=1 Tax=Arthrobacter psychrolactophilus TaxID=92442 RepID=UPI0011B7E651|nr:hypothetical protein [Arthrobacter psychrolactophilus]